MLGGTTTHPENDYRVILGRRWTRQGITSQQVCQSQAAGTQGTSSQETTAADLQVAAKFWASLW
jgi:hypothetical protein